jgi:OPA family glycerol-3-phosphate transporter-like MFS transporter/OPA family sugar phosphate sensor protein UhpC-like MFS transporter
VDIPPIAKILTNWIEPQKFATKMAFFDVSHSLGAALIVVLCGYLVTSLSWRWCFWLPAIFAFLVVALSNSLIKDTPKNAGFENLDNKKTSQEMSRKEYFELIKTKVFKNKPVMFLAITNLGVYCLRFAILDWGPTFLKETKSLSITGAVGIVAVFECAGILGMFCSGFVTDKIFKGHAHRTSAIALAMAMVSLTCFVTLPNVSPIVYIFLLACAGFFNYCSQVQGGVAAMKLATRTATGAAMGFLNYAVI